MPPQNKRWQIAPPVPPIYLTRFRGLPLTMVQLLYNRGLHDPEQMRAFLQGEGLAYDPFRLQDMELAVARLRKAINASEPIAVYGDFDADGVTATVLLMQVLQALGGQVRPYIPDRVDEGYGLNAQALKNLADEGIRLVITVDCGIRSIAEGMYAREIGLDLIITDHHTVRREMPPALAVINPMRSDNAYPFGGLAGVGVAFKVAQALLQGETAATLHEADLLDLVALGTVADLVPLLHENRALVRAGLTLLNAPVTRRPGLAALLKSSGLAPGKVDATAIAFLLGPRLNAAGRLGSAMTAYDLLTAPDRAIAEPLAQELSRLNQNRQQLTDQAVAQAKAQLEAAPSSALILFAESEDFRAGIVGLIAGRLTEEFYRPTIVMEKGPETTRGSARSIPEFHITAALDECSSLLVKHGGHAAAAGFTVLNENLPALKERLQDLATQQLHDQELAPVLSIDAEVRLGDLTEELQRQLARLQPCGYGNPEPVLCIRGARVVDPRLVGASNRHLKFTLDDGRTKWDAIAFRQAARFGDLSAMMDVAFTLGLDEWNGKKRLQLKVEDMRPTV